MDKQEQQAAFKVSAAEDGALIAVGTLRHGLKLGAEELKEFELRESGMTDVFVAEGLSPAGRPLGFAAALMCQQLRRLGSFKGPFTMEMISKLRKHDFAILREAQLELDAQGEA